jgi:hypothetical protein
MKNVEVNGELTWGGWRITDYLNEQYNTGLGEDMFKV